MEGLGFLGIAYGLVWLGIVAFLFAVSRRQRSLEKRVEDLLAAEKRAGSQ